MSVNDENILGHLREFQEDLKEYKTISKDISNYRKQYSNRIKELKSKLDANEKIIMQYMKMNNHPGINYKGMVVTLDKKLQCNRLPVNQREKQIDTVFQRHNVDNTSPLYTDLKELFIKQKKLEKLKLQKPS